MVAQSCAVRRPALAAMAAAALLLVSTQSQSIHFTKLSAKILVVTVVSFVDRVVAY
jgi:hypothetical protein